MCKCTNSAYKAGHALVSIVQQRLTWGRVELYMEDICEQVKSKEKNKTKLLN